MINQIGLILVLTFIGLNMTITTSEDCPENYYGNGSMFDLLDRSWCDELTKLD